MNDNRLPWSRKPPARLDGVRAQAPGPRRIGNNRALIAGVASLVALVGTLHALSVTPLYDANLLIQLQDGPGATEPGRQLAAATEIELLRSRAILAPVVDRLALDLAIAPKRLPLIGVHVADGSMALSKPGLFGAGGYAWGAERIEVARLRLPAELMGQVFELTALADGRFTLVQAQSGVRATGRVGEPLVQATPSGDIGLLVSAMRARPGAGFTLRRMPAYQAVDQLQRSLIVAESAKQSNLIRVALEGSDPVLIARILNDIGDEYLRQHGMRRGAATAQALAQYDRQLAQSTAASLRLDRRMAALLRRYGTADPGEENRLLGQQSMTLQAELAAVRRNRSDLSSRYLDQHPSLRAVDQQLRQLTGNLARNDAKRAALVLAGQEVSALAHERQFSDERQAGLLDARGRLERAGAASRIEVRVIDRAEPPLRSTTLGLATMIVLSCVGGLLLGAAASALRNAWAAQRDRLAGGADGPVARRMRSPSLSLNGKTRVGQP